MIPCPGTVTIEEKPTEPIQVRHAGVPGPQKY